MLSVQFQNELSSTLNALLAKGTNLDPFMKAVGEALVDSTKQRFHDAQSPDGTPWAPNTETTLARYLANFKGTVSRRGGLTQKGRQRLAAKKPLQGETKSLSTTINWQLDGNVLHIGSPMEYAATQQFGAKRGAYGVYNKRPTPWGDIPARPFLGVSAEDEVIIQQLLQDFLKIT